MKTPKVARLRLLGRSDCGLCEEMAAQLAAGFPQLASLTEHCDVDSRDDWRRRYGLRIPVLLDEWDEVVCEGRLDGFALAELEKNSTQRR